MCLSNTHHLIRLMGYMTLGNCGAKQPLNLDAAELQQHLSWIQLCVRERQREQVSLYSTDSLPILGFYLCVLLSE